jgi:hypothetical protein
MEFRDLGRLETSRRPRGLRDGVVGGLGASLRVPRFRFKPRRWIAAVTVPAGPSSPRPSSPSLPPAGREKREKAPHHPGPLLPPPSNPPTPGEEGEKRESGSWGRRLREYPLPPKKLYAPRRRPDRVGQVSIPPGGEGREAQTAGSCGVGASGLYCASRWPNGKIPLREGVDSRRASPVDSAGSTPPMVPPGTGAVKSLQAEDIP